MSTHQVLLDLWFLDCFDMSDVWLTLWSCKHALVCASCTYPYFMLTMPLRSSELSSLQTCILCCLLLLFSCWVLCHLVTPLWLTALSASAFLSFQRHWASSWPAAVPPPDTASSKSCQVCASTAVTQTYVTPPPPGKRAHCTTSVHWPACCCSGCGCDKRSAWRGAQRWSEPHVRFRRSPLQKYILYQRLCVSS